MLALSKMSALYKPYKGMSVTAFEKLNPLICFILHKANIM